MMGECASFVHILVSLLHYLCLKMSMFRLGNVTKTRFAVVSEGVEVSS